MSLVKVNYKSKSIVMSTFKLSPKEQANELGNKFYQGSVFDYDKEGHRAEIVRAKERAKICVKEIIKATSGLVPMGYWDEVIKEIDLLGT